jgi:septal ring factor EnvC (AmiA/AmiB activator)
MIISSDVLQTTGSILQVLGVLVVILTSIALLVLAVKRKAADQALKEWQQLAVARLETINQERSEKEQVQKELAQLSHHLGECERLRNDFAANNLRLNARLSSYERCINSLESALHRPLTNFDDPFRDLTA